eukprot:GABV01013043.1.p2 GENE.GABV01013043.1~~GABV01013043.1.p2  ORF type:complete len:107 (+),score=41.75 GABV01013043.1:66-386(+)
MQIASKRHNFPLPLEETTMLGDPADPSVVALAKRLAYLDQHDEQTWIDNKFFQGNNGLGINDPRAQCRYINIDGGAPNPNDVQNCAKLNAAPSNFALLTQFQPKGG